VKADSGPFPFEEGDRGADLINAGKQTITTLPGQVSLTQHSVLELIRGQHVDNNPWCNGSCRKVVILPTGKSQAKMVKRMGGQ
jgi:3-oxoacid CoA-transferase subunit B